MSTLETCYIQFSVFRQAKGLPALPPVPRPRRYIYPTFETSLPSHAFPALHVDAAELVPDGAHGLKPGKPDLCCKFCVEIKAYGSIVGLWSHLINKHGAIDKEERLSEIRRTALLWRTYWNEYSDGGKYGNPTQSKLDQTEKEGFGWEDVVAWNIR